VNITRAGTQASGTGPADWFTGSVRIDSPFQRTTPARIGRAIVRFEPGERHWHGASPTTAMTHVAIAEMLDGKAVEWMEHVTDEQYGR
jgi:quercetin dioxygenase-like cupin family protein